MPKPPDPKPVIPQADVAPQLASDAGPTPAEAADASQALGKTERRQMVRLLPTPQAVESDGDSDWAVFQNLLSDKPEP